MKPLYISVVTRTFRSEHKVITTVIQLDEEEGVELLHSGYHTKVVLWNLDLTGFVSSFLSKTKHKQNVTVSNFVVIHSNLLLHWISMDYADLIHLRLCGRLRRSQKGIFVETGVVRKWLYINTRDKLIVRREPQSVKTV